MALVFCDGFDHYMGMENILKKWNGQTRGTNPTFEISPLFARPPGGMGFRCSYHYDPWYGLYKNIPAIATIVSGFNILFPITTTTNNPFWAAYDAASGGVNSTTPQLWLCMDGAAHLRLMSGSATLATSSNAFSPNVWYHIEIKATINNSTGSYEVRVDGTSTGWIPAATSQNTRQQSSNSWVDAVALHSMQQSGTSAPSIDDFYVLDTTGSVANDFIGPQKIITVFPTGAGNSAQFTGNYAANFANANETTSDGDSTFNQSSTAGHIDLFDFDNVPTGTISAVQHVVQARQDAGAARTIRTKTRIGGSNYNGSSVNLSGSHRFIMEPVTLNPADSAAWEATDVNGAEFGYELVS
jgi:hypothetical protein